MNLSKHEEIKKEYERVVQGLNKLSKRVRELERQNTLLKGYKWLEEQGRLLILPCAEGETVYAIYRRCEREGSKIRCLYSNENQSKGCPRECKLSVELLDFSIGMFSYMDKSIFLTREQAEAKLKELEGE